MGGVCSCLANKDKKQENPTKLTDRLTPVKKTSLANEKTAERTIEENDLPRMGSQVDLAPIAESSAEEQNSIMLAKLNGETMFSPRGSKIQPMLNPETKPDIANEILYTDPVAPDLGSVQGNETERGQEEQVVHKESLFKNLNDHQENMVQPKGVIVPVDQHVSCFEENKSRRQEEDDSEIPEIIKVSPNLLQGETGQSETPIVSNKESPELDYPSRVPVLPAIKEKKGLQQQMHEFQCDQMTEEIYNTAKEEALKSSYAQKNVQRSKTGSIEGVITPLNEKVEANLTLESETGSDPCGKHDLEYEKLDDSQSRLRIPILSSKPSSAKPNKSLDQPKAAAYQKQNTVVIANGRNMDKGSLFLKGDSMYGAYGKVEQNEKIDSESQVTVQNVFKLPAGIEECQVESTQNLNVQKMSEISNVEPPVITAEPKMEAKKNQAVRTRIRIKFKFKNISFAHRR